jgi:hypothetical protein
MLNTVPKTISPEIRAFCLSIAPSRPLFIRSKPCRTAMPSACFDNVADKIMRAGGSMSCGWAIWIVPGICYEAEHHGAWRSRGGEIIDVSPQPNNGRRILFLPDDAAPYDPQAHRSNIIRPVEGNPLASQFVELANRRNAIQDAYRADGNRVALFTISDQRELEEIRVGMLRLWGQLNG